MRSLLTRRRLLGACLAGLCVWGALSLNAAPELSEGGARAYQEVKRAEKFFGDAVGYAGSTPDVVWAFRDLLAEQNADAAFKALLKEATLPGQLYALCGLWFTDQTAFKKQVARYRGMKGNVETMIGCIMAADPISELVESKDPNVIRLNGPADSMKDWWARHPNASAAGDIAGGYWPSELKGDVEKWRPRRR